MFAISKRYPSTALKLFFILTNQRKKTIVNIETKENIKAKFNKWKYSKILNKVFFEYFVCISIDKFLQDKNIFISIILTASFLKLHYFRSFKLRHFFHSSASVDQSFIQFVFWIENWFLPQFPIQFNFQFNIENWKLKIDSIFNRWIYFGN